MRHQFVLAYSCYENKMKVLLDGKTPLASDSVVLQYTNEPFEQWCDVILDLLYRELFEDYTLVYIGRSEEAEILQRNVEQHQHCQQLIYQGFQCNSSLQERMIALSKILKEGKTPRLPPIQRTIVFCGMQSQLNRLASQIQSLDVSNQYCRLNFIMEEYPPSTKQDVIFLAESLEDAERIQFENSINTYAFILIEGNCSRFVKSHHGYFIYQYDKHAIFESVFACLLFIPLKECFSKYLNALIERTRAPDQRKRLVELLIVKPRAFVSCDTKVEVGHSIPLVIEMLPQNAAIPELSFECQIQGIVNCTQKRIYGEKEGQTQILVFEKGEFEPLGSLEISVFVRNRIKQLTLSESFHDCGEGDTFQLTYKYLPDDADNASSIQWYSDYPEVAKVTPRGVVHAIASGECQIFCTAEHISTSCKVRCRPYLRAIQLKGEADGGIIHLDVGERREIEWELKPASAYDHHISMASQNMMVVNVVKQTLIGVSNGTTTVMIENNTHGIRREIQVTVGVLEEEQPKKKRFFGLF